MPTPTKKQHLHLKRGCDQCNMCTKCKEKILRTEEQEITRTKIGEKTCEKCGLKVQCEDCKACPKCMHRYSEKQSSISLITSESIGSRSSPSATSMEVHVGSNEAKHVDISQAKSDGSTIVQEGDHQQEEEKMVIWYPPHIDPAKHPLIPFPLPAPQVELRASRLMTTCLCLKRNGLQSDCPKTGCQGNPQCLRYLVPACIPSGFTLANPKEPYLQKADDPECYSKTDLMKVQTAGKTVTTGGGDGAQTKSSSAIIEEDLDRRPVTGDLKIRRHLPNVPPNYISEPPVDDYKAPCRRHGKRGIPGSGKYTKYARCRLKDGKTMPKILHREMKIT